MSGAGIRSGLRGSAVLAILAASLLLILQTARYLTFDFHYAFLLERPLLTGQRLWSTCFYVHVAGGILCLSTAPILLWNGLRQGSRGLHRRVGRLHAVAALGWTAPTGLYLALFAKGGLLGQLGFGLLGAWFTATSLLGIVAIRRGDLASHTVWMVRSYALILSAVWFRLFYHGLHVLGVDASVGYVLATWASLALAILSGELCGRNLAAAAVARPALQPVLP